MASYTAAPLSTTATASTKRNRSSSRSSSNSINAHSHTAHKSTRISTSPPPHGSSSGTALNPYGSPSSSTATTTLTHRLLCTLPPTCTHRPTPLANTKELESHYATYHAHVCEQHGCGCVFPDARLLELHQTENHDPLASLRKERGDKIFGCHLPTCTRFFLTPKTRRLHLISAHNYPKEYFFAVTNKGVGGLLKKWGEGASMIRGEWKARGRKLAEFDGGEEGEDEEGKRQGGGKRAAKKAGNKKLVKMDVDPNAYREKMDIDGEDDDDDDDEEEDSDSDDDDEDDEDESSDLNYQNTKEKSHTPQTYTNNPTYPPSNPTPSDKQLHAPPSTFDPQATPRPPISSIALPAADDADGLAHSLSSLALVPPSIRFGRGAKSGGFSHSARGGSSAGRLHHHDPGEHAHSQTQTSTAQTHDPTSPSISISPEDSLLENAGAGTGEVTSPLSPTSSSHFPSDVAPNRGHRGRGRGTRGRGIHRGGVINPQFDGIALARWWRGGRGRARGALFVPDDAPPHVNMDVDVLRGRGRGRGSERGFSGRGRRGRILARGI